MTSVPRNFQPSYSRKSKKITVPPGAIYVFEQPVVLGKRHWTCSQCDKEGQWNGNWRSYGSELLDDEGVTVPLCSKACQADYDQRLKGLPPAATIPASPELTIQEIRQKLSSEDWFSDEITDLRDWIDQRLQEDGGR